MYLAGVYLSLFPLFFAEKLLRLLALGSVGTVCFLTPFSVSVCSESMLWQAVGLPEILCQVNFRAYC